MVLGALRPHLEETEGAAVLLLDIHAFEGPAGGSRSGEGDAGARGRRGGLLADNWSLRCREATGYWRRRGESDLAPWGLRGEGTTGP